MKAGYPKNCGLRKRQRQQQACALPQMRLYYRDNLPPPTRTARVRFRETLARHHEKCMH